MNNSIYLRRKRKVYLEKGDNTLSSDYLFNMLANLESLGFTFSPELLEVINTLSEGRFKSFYKQLIKDLEEMVGAYVEYNPMYPNFPEQVIKASEEELKANAFWHYLGDWIGRRIMPEYEKKEREPLKDEVQLKVINLGSKEDFNAIFTGLLSAKSSISEADKQDIEWYVKNYGTNVLNITPEEIPLKENLALFISYLLKSDIELNDQIESQVKTATVVLRIAVGLSDGDVSLAANTKFANISKKNRRLLLQLLENAGDITEDMLRYKNRWKRLGERLHPFEYKKRFPQVYQAFDIIRNDKPFRTFNSKVEVALHSGEVQKAVNLLKTRPGEMARRLDHLIRNSGNPEAILLEFQEVASDVSSPVLLQVKTHFEHRNNPRELRVFFPKGDIGKVKAIDNNLPEIEEGICRKAISICNEALIERFSKYKPLGKVYLDESLKNYTVPFGLRSASKTLNTIPTGSRINLPKGDTIRFFIYWKNGINRTDIDLSALALDESSSHRATVAYYNLKVPGIYHSGDITSAPDGASEFIDINIPQCIKQKMRYILMSVNSYTWQPYSDLPICFAGFMVRGNPESGEIYEPATVSNKFDLTANTKLAIPMIVDLIERKVIWTDLALKSNPSANNNVHNNLSSLAIINKAMVSGVRPNLYDLLNMHITARGKKTLDINEANTIFAVDQGIKPSDIDVILSEYL